MSKQIVKKRNSFFTNKTCDICKRPAKIFRTFNNKRYVLCEERECDLATKIREGWIIPLSVK